MKTKKIVNRVPPFAQLPPLRCIPGTNEYGWHDVREFRQCLADILISQGGRGKYVLPDALQSFTPKKNPFIWVTENTQTGVLLEHSGMITECSFAPEIHQKIYVPSGWGIGVARTVNLFGVVEIHSTDEHGVMWGRRWNGEHYSLDKKEQLWLR
ncbi:MAG: hypothetical protein V4524_03670 [Patescibacteria group bacterium]